MSKTTRRLGRGLDSLISNLRNEPSARSSTIPLKPGEPEKLANPEAVEIGKDIAPAPFEIPLDRIAPNPFQPRASIDDSEIGSLAASISQHGLLQPITVRQHGTKFQIIAGERRWRAAKKAGLTAVPVSVRQATDEQMLELALVENLQREDLNAIDRAKAYRQFCREFSLSTEEVAERLGEDRSTVANYIRLLELEAEIQEFIASGILTMGHARSLLGVSDPKRRLSLAKASIDRGLSVRAMEELVRLEKQDPAGQRAVSATKLRSPHFKDLETQFERSVKTKVTIHEGRRKNRGRIVIEYYSLDDFDRIAGLLGVETG